VKFKGDVQFQFFCFILESGVLQMYQCFRDKCWVLLQYGNVICVVGCKVWQNVTQRQVSFTELCIMLYDYSCSKLSFLYSVL